MKRTLKKLAALALTVTTAMTFVACSGGEQKTKENSQASSDTILLGGIGPLTGDAAMYGISTYNGVQLAIDEINEAGGVLGKKIVLNKMDDKNDTVEAANAFNKLVEEKTVAQIAAGNKIPMLTPTGTAQSITTHGENIFRAPFIDPYQGEVMAQFANDELKVKKVAVIRNTASDYSDGLATAFVEKAKELGIEVVADESYKDADADFKAQLTKVSLIAPQAREVGITARLIGGDGWDGVIKSMGADKLSSIEGSYFCNTFALDDKDEKLQSFIKKYNETYKENPQSFSALGYDSVYLMVEAIKKANSTDSAAIVDALKNIEYTGVTGSYRFDENRNPIKSVFMTTIENGQYKLFKKFEAK